MFSHRPSTICGKKSAAVLGSKKDLCTSAQPGVLITVSQTITATTSVLARLISTDRPDCFLRNARRPSSTGLGSSAVVRVGGTT